jgi:beta-lactamase class A
MFSKLSKKLTSITFLKISFIISLCGFGVFFGLYLAGSKLYPEKNKPSEVSTPCASNLVIIRENEDNLIHPLLLVDVESESGNYLPLKGLLAKTISNYIQNGTVQTASVYLRQMRDGSWMSMAPNRNYYPGSLMKVPIMIYYLKQEELHPGYLNKEFLYEKPKQNFPSQIYRGDSISSGRKYKISELLRYMIEESDNNATFLLSKNLQPDLFRKIFTDLDIPPDEINDITYQTNVREYEKFFRVLYNATYLDDRLSQMALELLVGCKFNEGMARKIPQGISVARKFGEHGINNLMDFSEGGIVYKDGNPYILVVMTEGTDAHKQAALISEISDQVYQHM